MLPGVENAQQAEKSLGRFMIAGVYHLASEAMTRPHREA
jgi:hypothetical protein